MPRNPLPVHGALQATLDLEQAQVFLRSLRITAERRGSPSHTLEVTGDLEDFTHPRWHARVAGDLDMRLLDPITGFGDAPEGLARLDLTAAGQQNTFQIDGGVHVDGGSYIGGGITATAFTPDTHVHADGKQLLLTGIVARLRQGGQTRGRGRAWTVASQRSLRVPAADSSAQLKCFHPIAILSSALQS